MSIEFHISAGSAAGNGSRWLTEEVFKLIDMVQKDEAIYNPRHKYYFCRPYVENFWREVDLKLEKNPGASLAKWTNLRISFRREYTNYLEEKVPPCWSYFDRMFFLHPYLRKKHSQPKSLDSQVQDALVQISSLSNRLQRERAVAALAFNSQHTPSAQTTLDSYLDFYDDAEPNNSELDEIIEEERQEQQARFSNLDAVSNDIKLECIDDQIADYDSTVAANDDEAEELPNFEHDSMKQTITTTTTTNAVAEKRHERLQHLNRLKMRTYHDELRAKRSRSQESNSAQRSTLFCNSTPAAHTANVSLVRPTIAKPLDMPSHTVTNTVTLATTPQLQAAANSNHHTAIATQRPLPQQNIITTHHHSHPNTQQQQQQQQQNQHRLEINSIAASSIAAVPLVGAISGASPTRSIAPPAELCDCKTDPDAMFLMSLLPDIQKLNGRDRGKIKIAFQNILQDYLYPD